MMRAGVAAAAGLVAMAGSGCSFVFAHNPPPNHRELRYFDCPRSYTAPVVDTGVAVGATAVVLLAAAIAVSTGPFLGGGDFNAGRFALVAVPVVGLPTSSAVYGYVKVANCREAKAELVTRIQVVGP